MKITKLKTTKYMFFHDKKMKYLFLFVFLTYAIVLIDSACLGKITDDPWSLVNALLVGTIVNIPMLFFTINAIILGTELRFPGINKYEHLQNLEERYKLQSYIAINEMRAYVYWGAVLSIILGLNYVTTGTVIPGWAFAVIHVFGYFVLAKPFRQPEFFVKFLSDEYYLLLGREYYRVRGKDNLSKIKEVLK